MNLLARIISFLFHPLLLATYMFGLFTFSLPAGLDPSDHERERLPGTRHLDRPTSFQREVKLKGRSAATAHPRAQGTPRQVAQNGRDARRERANAEA